MQQTRSVEDIYADKTLSDEQKIKEIEKAQQAEAGPDIPADKRNLSRAEVKMVLQHKAEQLAKEVEEEKQGEAGDVVEIFSSYVTVNGVIVNKPNVQSIMIMQRMYGSVSGAGKAMNADISVAGCLGYVLANQFDKQFHRKNDQEIMDAAAVWFMQIDLADAINVLKAVDKAIMCQYTTKKKQSNIDLRKPPGEH